MMRSFSGSAGVFALCTMSVVLLSGCERTLVFGESTGFNLGVSVDAAKGTPIEINTGFKRHVSGIVPASKRPDNGQPRGEATSLISRFEVAQTGTDDDDPFNNRITISSAIASGKAATTIASGNTRSIAVVNSILGPRTVTASREPANINTANELAAFVNQSEANVTTYLSNATARNLIVPSDGPLIGRAITAIFNERNAQGNQAIWKEVRN